MAVLHNQGRIMTAMTAEGGTTIRLFVFWLMAGGFLLPNHQNGNACPADEFGTGRTKETLECAVSV